MNKNIYDKQKAANLVINSQFFKNPVIDFILYKQFKDKDRYIIGITDNHNPDQCYIFKPNSKQKVINQHSIHYKNKAERELFDECIEGYILLCLNSGYKLSYMNIQSHICIWDFIETYMYEVHYMLNGVKNYLQFCERTGVNITLMNYYADSIYPHFFDLYLNKDFQDNNIILQQTVGNIVLMICYQTKPYLIYEVILYNQKNKEIIYRHSTSQFTTAVTDYKNQYYEQCIQHYKDQEEFMKKCIDEFSCYLHNRGY